MTPLMRSVQNGLKDMFESEWKWFSAEVARELYYALYWNPKLKKVQIEITGPDIEPCKTVTMDELVIRSIEGIASNYPKPEAVEELDTLASACERLAKLFRDAAGKEREKKYWRT